MKKIFSLLTIICCLFAINGHVNALTYTVTVPDGTPMCYIAGAMNSWGLVEMDKVDGVANQFTITYPNAKETDEYKYWCGPDWKYEEAIDAQGTGLDANRTYAANDVVAFWKEIFYPNQQTVTIEVWAPMDVYVLYVVGTFNNWSGKFDDTYKMTYMGEEDGGKVFEISITSVDADNMEFKFVAGPDWAFEQTNSTNWKYGDLTGADTGKVSFALAAGDFKNIFNPDLAGDINIKVIDAKGADRVWIQGSFLGWTWDDPAEMTKEADGTFTYTVKFVQSIEYRLYNAADWAYPELDPVNIGADRENRIATFDVNNPGYVYEISVFEWKVPSAIPQISTDNFKVYSVNGQLVVEGIFSRVDIFDITGHAIQSAKTSDIFTSKSLPAGLYIVKVDGISKKAIVK
ncbi:MAG: hypothetical protein FWD60_03830 [Candidatus Azobacteroides sp.]|nr:hypothetical protein [Candidatus Azobacteroides sp.]